MEKKSISFTIGVFILGGLIIATVIFYILHMQNSQLAFINQTDLVFEVQSVTQKDENTYAIEAEILNNNLEWTLEENGLQIGESVTEETATDEVSQMVELIYGRNSDQLADQFDHLLLSDIETEENTDQLASISPFERVPIHFTYEMEDDQNDLLSIVFYSNLLQHRDGNVIRNIRTATELIELDTIE